MNSRRWIEAWEWQEQHGTPLSLQLLKAWKSAEDRDEGVAEARHAFEMCQWSTPTKKPKRKAK